MLKSALLHSVRKRYFYVLSFFLPLFILLIVYAIFGIYPFGGKSVLITDMSQQYVDDHARLYEVLTQGKSLLHTWNTGMGINFFGIFAFYLASPLSLIVVLFGRGGIPDALFVMILLKIGFCGLGFSAFAAKSKFIGLRGLPNVIFSTLYALMAYNVAYTTNAMWLDSVALLPVLMLCTEWIVEKRRMLPFIFWLAVCFMTHFYMSYMVGIFCFLYFLLICGSGKYVLTKKAFFGRLGLFIGSAMLTAGLCAFLLLPAFRTLTSSYLKLRGPALSMYYINTFAQVTVKLLPGVYDTITYGTPNVYMGVLPLLLLPLYFANREFSLKEKLISMLLVVFLYASMISEALYLAWHVFQYPTWFPARFSFVFCMLCLWLAMRGFRHIHSVSPPLLILSLVFCFGLVIIAMASKLNYVAHNRISLSIALITVYYLLLVLYRRSSRQRVRTLMTLLMLLCVCVETGISSYAYVKGMDKELKYDNRTDYNGFVEKYRPAIERIEREDPTPFYRIENLNKRNSNDGLSLRYKSVAHYSSFSNQGTNKLLSDLGMYATVNYRFFKYYASSPVTDSMLGIKYLIADQSGEYEKYIDQNGVRVYKNPYVFPLIYTANQKAATYTPICSDRIQNQNMFINNLLSVDDCYNRLDADRREVKGLKITGNSSFEAVPKGKDASISYLYTIFKSGHIYANITLSDSDDASLEVNGVPRFVPEIGDYVTDLGYFGKGSTLTLTLDIMHTLVMSDPDVYMLNMENFSKAATIAQSNGAQINEVTDTGIKAKLKTEKQEFVMTSIPADPGYRICVDGKKAEPVIVSGAFLGFNVGKGDHTIDIRFMPSGLIPGILISVFSLALLVFLIVWAKRRRLRYKEPKNPKEE